MADEPAADPSSAHRRSGGDGGDGTTATAPAAAAVATSPPPRRGVNLGGWLLVEKWMNESLFAAASPASRPASAVDEHSLAKALGSEAPAVFARHRDQWVTEADFAAIAAAGLNAVRIPLGFWVLDCAAAERHRGCFAGPAEHVLRRGLDWAQKHGVRANLCLHGCPGGPSGAHTTGWQRDTWTPADWDTAATLHCLRRLATAFGGHPAVAAVTVVNEPAASIPAGVLATFYACACKVVREGCRGAGRPAGAGDVAIIVPAYQRHWRELRPYLELLAAADPHVAVGLHLYQCFGDWWQQHVGCDEHIARAMSGQGHFPGTPEVAASVAPVGAVGGADHGSVAGADCSDGGGAAAVAPTAATAATATTADAPAKLRLVIGEWSLRLPTWDARWPCRRDLDALPDDAQREARYRAFAQAQLDQFAAAGAEGHYFWTWKVDAPSANGGTGEPFWDLRECLACGRVRFR